MWEPVGSQGVPVPGCGGDIALVTSVVVHEWANVPSVDPIRIHLGSF